MGIVDHAKGLLGKSLDKGKELAEDNADKIKAGIGKVEGLADKATRRKYTGKIEAAVDKVEGLIPGKGEGDAAAEGKPTAE